MLVSKYSTEKLERIATSKYKDAVRGYDYQIKCLNKKKVELEKAEKLNDKKKVDVITLEIIHLTQRANIFIAQITTLETFFKINE